MRLSFAPLATVVLAASVGATIAARQAPLPKGQMPELGRPTKVGDELPLFNFDEYFAGKWTFEWDMPEGVLGESGQVTGTTIYKVIEPGKSYAADTDAVGPGGAFKVHETITYEKEQKMLSRQVTDSRGFAYTQSGPIGGDLGGIYNILLDSTPFIYNGHAVRLKHTVRTMSPFNYKVTVSVSVDGGPFRNYGNPWWRKDTTAAK